LSRPGSDGEEHGRVAEVGLSRRGKWTPASQRLSPKLTADLIHSEREQPVFEITSESLDRQLLRDL